MVRGQPLAVAHAHHVYLGRCETVVEGLFVARVQRAGSFIQKCVLGAIEQQPRKGHLLLFAEREKVVPLDASKPPSRSGKSLRLTMLPPFGHLEVCAEPFDHSGKITQRIELIDDYRQPGAQRDERAGGLDCESRTRPTRSVSAMGVGGDSPSWTVAGSTPAARATIRGYGEWSDVKAAVD